MCKKTLQDCCSEFLLQFSQKKKKNTESKTNKQQDFRHMKLTAEIGLNLFIWNPSPNHVCNVSISQNIYKKDTLCCLFLLTSTPVSASLGWRTISYISKSSFILLEKVHEKILPTTFLFHSIFLTTVLLFWVLLKKLSLACFQLQTGSQKLVCLLRGSDIFALQEVQLQHHQILQMLNWSVLFTLALFL